MLSCDLSLAGEHHRGYPVSCNYIVVTGDAWGTLHCLDDHNYFLHFFTFFLFFFFFGGGSLHLYEFYRKDVEIVNIATLTLIRLEIVASDLTTTLYLGRKFVDPTTHYVTRKEPPTWTISSVSNYRINSLILFDVEWDFIFI